MHNTTPPATSASLAPHTLAMSCYGYDSRKPEKCRKQLNGHLSFQTTITNRLESTFPPHLCKKIKFVPDSRQPFENGRIFNLAVGLQGPKQIIGPHGPGLLAGEFFPAVMGTWGSPARGLEDPFSIYTVEHVGRKIHVQSCACMDMTWCTLLTASSPAALAEEA